MGVTKAEGAPVLLPYKEKARNQRKKTGGYRVNRGDGSRNNES